MATCISCEIDKIKHQDEIKTGKDCGIDNSTSGDCDLNDDGTPVTPPDNGGGGSCVDAAGQSITCPEVDTCSPWDLTENNDTCQVDNYVDEQLNIAGAKMNVHKLLGIHEQGTLTDLTTSGTAISSGSLSNFPADNAFTKYRTEWRSAQTGTTVNSKTYIGFDFGPIKLSNGRDRYGIETSVKRDISLIKIKQGCDSQNRATKIRLEHSEDGVKWYGAGVANAQDCDGLVTLAFPRTVPSRFWRLRPVAFNGGTDDYWTIQALQMMEYEKTEVRNIQDRILLENRDRDYMATPIPMKCYFTPIDVQSAASKFGFYQTETYTLEVATRQTVAFLGRPFVIGDIVEIPALAQLNTSLSMVKKYLEIVDVSWSITSYTASWIPTMLRLLAVPAMASQETQQIFGKLTEDVDSSGLADINDGSSTKYQDIGNINNTIKARANTDVPERGEDHADIAKISDEALAYAKLHPNMNLNKLNIQKNIYSKDGLPPNGLPFTEGDEFPANPKTGDYHRLTYVRLGNGKDIPPKLYRFSKRKGLWIFIEDDKRYGFKKTKPMLQDFIDPETSTVTNPKREDVILDKN